MLFASILISFLTFKFLPWWGIVPIWIAVGFLRPAKWTLDVLLAAVVGMVGVAMAFYADGATGGLISQRMSGLFSLPQRELIFAVVFGINWTTAFLSVRAGAVIRLVSQ